ncbi:hypothetical protein [Pararobbsia silviterrae]|nr:hypothetical protein [Pararobbsia silviterrae]
MSALWHVNQDLPKSACMSRLTAIDNPRFDRVGSHVRFDGTLLFRPRSLYVEGAVDVADKSYRVHRMIEWETRWLSPRMRERTATRIYYGDTLPTALADQLPLIGEHAIEIEFIQIDSWLFAVVSNDVFVTYCRRLPSIVVDPNAVETLDNAHPASRPSAASQAKF